MTGARVAAAANFFFPGLGYILAGIKRAPRRLVVGRRDWPHIRRVRHQRAGANPLHRHVRQRLGDEHSLRHRCLPRGQALEALSPQLAASSKSVPLARDAALDLLQAAGCWLLAAGLEKAVRVAVRLYEALARQRLACRGNAVRGNAGEVGQRIDVAGSFDQGSHHRTPRLSGRSNKRTLGRRRDVDRSVYTPLLDGTRRAIRITGSAHLPAQVHHRLIPVTGTVDVDHRLGERSRLGVGQRRAMPAGENPPQVRVNRRRRNTETDRTEGRRGVRADAR